VTSGGGNPWADPATPTQAGPPYAGPPPTSAPYPGPYGSYGYGSSGYGQPYGYAPPPYDRPQPYYQPYAPWPPGARAPWAQGPERPGPVIAAAVLAFVQATVVLIVSLYLWFFASVADLATGGMAGAYSSTTIRALATEGSTLALLQLLSAVLLVVAGILALNRRTRAAWLRLITAHAVQLLLAGYWTVRLMMLLGDLPGDDPQSAFLTLTLFFAAGPAVAVGLLLVGSGRRWFDGTAQP
jgi:hypothetical protein